MTARLLEGAPVADAVLADVARRTAALRDRGVGVGLGTILVGDDAASAGYVRKKHETCEKAGILSRNVEIPASAGVPGPGHGMVELLHLEKLRAGRAAPGL